MPQETGSPLTEVLDLPPGSGMWRKEFLFGCATAAYQIEGAVAEDGRLQSIWDVFSHTPGKILNGDCGDNSCDHYRHWASDLNLLSDLQVDAYRFSIAWPRVMDEKGRPNSKGFDFYKRILDRLLEKKLKSFVTLYHWDLPQYIEERGGWLNRDSAFRLAEYADLASRELSGRVTAWSTINEPLCSAWLGYGSGEHAPGVTGERNALQAMHHLLLGHGLAMKAIRYNNTGANLGIVANLGVSRANTNRLEDQRAAELFEIWHNNWVLDPLLKASYPSGLFELWPGLEPLVVSGDMATIATPADYMGINYYFRTNVESDGAHGYRDVFLENVERTQMGWEVYPEGLRQLLVGLKKTYSNLPPIYITENGMASNDQVIAEQVDDAQRISFLRRHMAAVSQAIAAGVDVRGYFVWSLLDNFEWAYGYERRFGLFHVDYTTQKRTAKNSAKAFAQILAKRRTGI